MGLLGRRRRRLLWGGSWWRQPRVSGGGRKEMEGSWGEQATVWVRKELGGGRRPVADYDVGGGR